MSKAITKIFAAVLLSIGFISCHENKDINTRLFGKVERYYGGDCIVFSFDPLTLNREEIAVFKPDSTGTFSVEVDVKEFGQLFIEVPAAKALFNAYVMPGRDVEFKLATNRPIPVVTDTCHFNQTVDNIYSPFRGRNKTALQGHFEEVDIKPLTDEDFVSHGLKVYDEILQSINQYAKIYNLQPNEVSILNYSAQRSLIYFLGRTNPRAKSGKISLYDSYYRIVDSLHVDGEGLALSWADSGIGLQMLEDRFLRQKGNESINWMNVELLPEFMAFIDELYGRAYYTEVIKARYLMHFMSYLKAEQISQVESIASGAITSVPLRNKVSDKALSLKGLSPGQKAPGFTVSDAKGNDVSLDDFKGKYVLIDVWASWCVPCRKEFPIYLDIIEPYKEREDVVFLFISIDDVKTRKHWEALIEKKKLPQNGRHLIAERGNFSEFNSTYRISAVPTLMIIDKEGNMVTNHAPYASSGELGDFLKNILDK